MNFIAQSQEELKKLNLQENETYKIEFLNRDYFNGDLNLEIKESKLLIDENGNYIFIIQDDYGMDKYIKEARIIN